jgi:hypothetical protein
MMVCGVVMATAAGGPRAGSVGESLRTPPARWLRQTKENISRCQSPSTTSVIAIMIDDRHVGQRIARTVRMLSDADLAETRDAAARVPVLGFAVPRRFLGRFMRAPR